MEIASNHNNWHHNPYLTDRARYLRKHMTKSEACLWKYGLKNGMMGAKFLRQRPVLHYIADFLCRELLLIIECDGITHQMEGADERDRKRDAALEAVGFKVLRFDDSMVLNHLTTTLGIIEQEVKERKVLFNSHRTSDTCR